MDVEAEGGEGGGGEIVLYVWKHRSLWGRYPITCTMVKCQTFECHSLIRHHQYSGWQKTRRIYWQWKVQAKLASSAKEEFELTLGVFLVKTKNALLPVEQVYSVNIFMNFHRSTREWAKCVSEPVNGASKWSECSEAERCGASERNERCKRTNVASDRVAR